MTFSDSIPWQSAYDRFRQAHPTGGLLFDLVAVPNGQHNQYVVKALAQIGNLPIVSVLAEASDLSTAEAQACYKLCQILGLSPQATAPREEFREELKIAPPLPKVVPSEKPAPSLPELTRSSPETLFEPMPTIAPEPRSSATPKSEPYRLSPSLSREAISPIAPTSPIAPISPISPTIPQGGDDWTEELAQIDLELRRLGWTIAEESAYLQEQYGKASRDHITDYGELLQFLTALQAMPVSYRGIETWNPHTPPHRYNPSPQIGLDRVSLNNVSLNNVSLNNIGVSGVSQQAALPLEEPVSMFEPDLNFSRDEMMEQVMAEIRRIGWGKRQGSEYLLRTYGAKTRQELRDDQLQEFLSYLQNQPIE